MKKVQIDNQFSGPKGFQDYWNSEVKIRDYIRAKLAGYFRAYGYGRIEFPLIEKQDYFSVEMVGSHPWPGWHPKSLTVLPLKDYNSTYDGLPDATENYLLIPEGTTSLCRWVAKMLESAELEIHNDRPLRLFYSEPCFRNELTDNISPTKQRQFTQIGIELLGAEGPNPDIEVIHVMYKSLVNLGFPFEIVRVRISDVRIFNHLLKSFKVKRHIEYQLKDTLDSIASANVKSSDNLPALKEQFNKLLQKAGLSEDEIETWKFLLNGTYYGSEDIMPVIGKTGLDKAVMKELKTILETLEELGYNAVFDPSIIRSQEYYTSTAFQADILLKDRIIAEIAGGGRYDKFVGNFLRRYKAKDQREVAGTGFAFSLERLAETWKSLGVDIRDKILFDTKEDRIDKLIYSKYMTEALQNAESLIDRDYRVEVYLGSSLSKAEKYAELLNVDFVKK